MKGHDMTMTTMITVSDSRNRVVALMRDYVPGLGLLEVYALVAFFFGGGALK